MLKKCLGLTLVLFMPVLLLFAADEQQGGSETFTITTYYPSPYGSYNQLEVYRSVTYKPVNKDTITDPRQGEMVYNSGDDSIYVYNGSKWVTQGGGGATYTAYGTTECATGWTRAYSGVAMTVVSWSNGGTTGVGGIVCKGGPSLSYWWSNGGITWATNQIKNSLDEISCAVCVK